MSDPTDDTPDARAASSDIRILSRHVAPDEVAAITTVLTAVIGQRRQRQAGPTNPRPNAWLRGAPGIQPPLDRGADAWANAPA